MPTSSTATSPPVAVQSAAPAAAGACAACDDHAGHRTAWDVGSWVLDPRQPFRLNSAFRDDSAIVTASGCFHSRAGVAEIGAALHPFERLDSPVVVDVYHAVLGNAAVAALVDAGVRRAPFSDGFSVVIIHADLQTRQRLACGGGALLLGYCSRSRSQTSEYWGRWL